MQFQDFENSAPSDPQVYGEFARQPSNHSANWAFWKSNNNRARNARLARQFNWRLTPMITTATRFDAALDVSLAIIVFLAARSLLDSLGVPKPASIAVVATLFIATLRMRQLGITWSDLGFVPPDSIVFTLLMALAAYIVTAMAVAFIVTPVANVLELPAPAFDKLGDLHNNLPYLLFMVVVIGWGTAAFGEELLFRGFLQSRLVSLFGSGLVAVVSAIVLQATLFGLGQE